MQVHEDQIAAEQSARAAPIAVTAAQRRSRGRNWLARLIAAFQESRMRAARAEVARRRHLLPAELELEGDRLDARSEQQLPFIRCD
jgi:hypothetical protein